MAANVEVVITAQDNASGVLEGIGGGLSNLGNIVSGIKAGFDLLAGAFQGVVDFGAQFVNSASEGELAVANLEATLGSMGDVTGLTSQQLQDMAGALQEVTRFSDESIINGQAMLLTFGNIGGEVFPRATEAMLDLAAKFGSIDQASVMLGKALNDPIAGVTALRRVGVQLTEQQEEAIKKFMEVGDIAGAQGVILGELERQVGGLAEAYGNTFAGKLDIFRNRIDEIKETIGNGLLPVLATIIDKFEPFFPVLEAMAGHLETIFKTLNVGLTEGNWSFFFGALERFDNFVGNIFQGIADAINEWANGSGPDDLVSAITSFIDGIGTGTEFKSKALTAAVNILEALANAFGQVDFSAVWKSVSELFGRAFDSVDSTGFIQKIADWASETLSQIDWSGIVQRIADVVSDALLVVLEGLDALVNQVDWSPLGNSLRGALTEAWQGAIEDGINGKSLWDNIVEGMEMGLRANPLSGLFIKGIESMIEGVKRVLGIASPSMVFFNIGRDIVLGLMGGWSSLAGTLLNLISSIVNTILDIFQPVLDILGFDTGTGGATGDATGTLGTGGTIPGIPAGGGTVINQYFSGATINVGSWDQIAYDCIYPNPFVSATSGQLGGRSGDGGHPR